MLPVGVAESASASPANVPPVTATVALASLRLSGSATDTVGDKVVGACSSVHDATVVPSDSDGGSLTLVTVSVVVESALVSLPPLSVPLGSVACHVIVRVRLEP